MNKSEFVKSFESVLQYKCGKPTPLRVRWIAQKYKTMCM